MNKRSNTPGDIFRRAPLSTSHDYKDAAPTEVVEQAGNIFLEAMKCFLNVPVQGARASVDTGLVRHLFNHYVTLPLQMLITLAALATNKHAALVTPKITTYDCSLEAACLPATGLDPRFSKYLRECSLIIIEKCPPWIVSVTGQSEIALRKEGFGRIPKNENESFNLRAYIYQELFCINIQVASSNQYDTITNSTSSSNRPVVRLLRHQCKQAFTETGCDVLAYDIHKAMRQESKVRIASVSAITLIPSTSVTLLVFDGEPSPSLNEMIRRVPPFDILADVKFKGQVLRGMDIITAYGRTSNEKINNSVSVFRNNQFFDGRHDPEVTSFASSADNSHCEHEEGECKEDSDQESAAGSTSSVAMTTTFTSANDYVDCAEESQEGCHKRKRYDSPPARNTRWANSEASSRVDNARHASATRQPSPAGQQTQTMLHHINRTTTARKMTRPQMGLSQKWQVTRSAYRQ